MYYKIRTNCSPAPTKDHNGARHSPNKCPDFDLDIDGLHPPRSHTNTAVVSVQEHFTPSEPEVFDSTESQAEDNTARESSDFI